jgi:hypothetical protein
MKITHKDKVILEIYDVGNHVFRKYMGSHVENGYRRIQWIGYFPVIKLSMLLEITPKS